MNIPQVELPTDTWVKASWDEYAQIIDNPQLEKAKGYYFNDRMRIEMPPVGNDHASDHSIVNHAHLWAGIKGIDLNGKDNCTYRKIGIWEAQPDASYYTGGNAEVIPWGTTIIHLNPPPTLAIEVANTSLSDDIGEKRLLYEQLGVAEYWIVDVKNIEIFAFSVANSGSRKITQSHVLLGLEIVLEEALRQTRQMNHGRVSAWLLSQFQQ